MDICIRGLGTEVGEVSRLLGEQGFDVVAAGADGSVPFGAARPNMTCLVTADATRDEAQLFDLVIDAADSPKEAAKRIGQAASVFEDECALGTIAPFRGEHYFLSNFFEVDGGIVFDGLTYGSSEAIYQSLKTTDPELRRYISTLSPGESKDFVHDGMELRADWDRVIRASMKAALVAKFSQHGELRRLLLATRGHYLLELNHWCDNLWGVCSCEACQGLPSVNLLGKTLMQVRRELG